MMVLFSAFAASFPTEPPDCGIDALLSDTLPASREDVPIDAIPMFELGRFCRDEVPYVLLDLTTYEEFLPTIETTTLPQRLMTFENVPFQPDQPYAIVNDHVFLEFRTGRDVTESVDGPPQYEMLERQLWSDAGGIDRVTFTVRAQQPVWLDYGDGRATGMLMPPRLDQDTLWWNEQTDFDTAQPTCVTIRARAASGELGNPIVDCGLPDVRIVESPVEEVPVTERVPEPVGTQRRGCTTSSRAVGAWLLPLLVLAKRRGGMPESR